MFLYKSLRGPNMLGRFMAISSKEEYLCGFLFVLLDAMLLLKNGSTLYKERICFLSEQTLSV